MSFTPFRPEDVVSRQTVNEKLGGLAADNIPAGGIIIWSGAADAIPRGWRLCDGAEGTPDLRNRFVLGSGGEYGVGVTGGEETHKLTVSEMPSHTHNIGRYTGGGGGSYDTGITELITPLRATSLSYTGGSQPHNNMPPYFALCYIMKL